MTFWWHTETLEFWEEWAPHPERELQKQTAPYDMWAEQQRQAPPRWMQSILDMMREL